MKVIVKTIQNSKREVDLFYNKLNSLIIKRGYNDITLCVNGDYAKGVSDEASIVLCDRCRLLYTPCENEKEYYRSDVRDLLVKYDNVNEMLVTFATDLCENDYLNITINLDTDTIVIERVISGREVYSTVDMYVDRILTNEEYNEDYEDLKNVELEKLRK